MAKFTLLRYGAEVGAHLLILGLESKCGEPLMYVAQGQCNARPTVTFPAARHHHPLPGTSWRWLSEGVVVPSF